MHNLKYIRTNSELFIKKMKKRNIDFNINNLLKIDEKNRALINKKENLLQEKKTISKKKDKSQFEKSKIISQKIDKLDKEQNNLQQQIDSIIMELPNLPLDDVPEGKDDTFNKVVLKNGEIKKFSFKPLSHFELGKKLDLMDFDTATKTTGPRFVFLKGAFALLERAIANFTLDIHTQEFGYKEISPPLLANFSSMYGTGQLPKFENDQFEIKLTQVGKENRLFLIPTAEVILTNMVKKDLINHNKLPLRLVASTPCFRKEAGSYGKDTKGMIRQHQFNKTELVSIVDPKNCSNELERMTSCAETILQKLNLPYQKVLLSSGDMGFSAEKTYDLEVWIPSENKYREISSCSSCGEFQARRMQAKFKDIDKKNQFLGTLNGSGLAVGRTLVAIVENYQDKEGNITVPELLRPYMNELNKIAN